MTAPPAPAAAPVSAMKRLVPLLMIATSVGYVCRIAVTVVAPGMMRDFGLTQAQMGTVMGNCCLVAHRGIGGGGWAPVAWSGHRVRRRKLR